jgi:hypothetical protein
MTSKLFATILLATFALPLVAQEPPGRLVGRVVDHENGKALAGARVTLQGTQLNAITDNVGAFTLNNAPAGEAVLEVELIGYEKRTAPIRIRSRETIEAEVRLSSEPIALPPLEVTVRSARLEAIGFYDRRDEFGRQGRFMDRAYIERRSPQIVSDLFYNQPSMQVLYGGAGVRRIIINRGGGCDPDIYIDGSLAGGGAIDASRPEHIEGIEVYVGAFTPIQYKSRTDCGVILVWTRQGRR